MAADRQWQAMVRWLQEHVGRASESRWLRFAAVVCLLALVLGGTGGPDRRPPLLQRLASWPGFGRGPARDVAMAGHCAYVAVEEGGLLVFDVADPGKPVRVASLPLAGLTQIVRVTGSRAYVATKVVRGGGGCESDRWRGRLVILNISDPTKPAILGGYTTSREIQCLCADGDRVYVCDSMDGLHIVDVSDPARPAAFSVGKPEECQGLQTLWACGSQLYCAVYGHWEVVDVSKPAAPVVLTGADSQTGLSLRGVCGSSNAVLVVEGDFGYSGQPDCGCLSVYTFNATSGLLLKGKLEMATPALNVTVAGTTAFVAAGTAGIVAVDISNPAYPRQLGTQNTPGLALSAVVAGTNAFVADYFGGIQVLDVHDPLHITTVSSVDTGLTTWKLRVVGDRAYLMSCDSHPSLLSGYEARSRLEILDVKDPHQPTLLATYDLPKLAMNLDASDKLVALGYDQADRISGEGMQRMLLLDVSVPTHPVWLSDTRIDSGSDDLALRLEGNYAYVSSVGTNGFQIYDISRPTSPRLVGQNSDWQGCEEVRLSGSRVYLLQDYGLEVIDTADPRLPKLLGSVSFEYGDALECST